LAGKMKTVEFVAHSIQRHVITRTSFIQNPLVLSTSLNILFFSAQLEVFRNRKTSRCHFRMLIMGFIERAVQYPLATGN